MRPSVAAVIAALFLLGALSAAAQAPPPTPDELQLFETFRAWQTAQPGIREVSDQAALDRHARGSGRWDLILLS